MTEAEAKTKWCPFARVVIETMAADPQPVTAANRIETTGTGEPDLEWPAPLCIASACMAWRWNGERAVPASITAIAGHMREHSVGPLDAAGATATRVSTGYCGLAGVPA